jgi:SAM-dependent methyltransferase
MDNVRKGAAMIELLWNAPVSELTMAKVFEALELDPGGFVLDVGCGCGEVLIRLHERFGIEGLGIDISTAFLREARRRAEGRVPGAMLRFQEADARTLAIRPESVNLAVCLGATHAFGLGDGAYRTALAHLRSWAVPGGLILVAEGFLMQPASPAYRALIGDFPPDERTHAGNVAVARDLGLTPLAAWTSSVNEWDDFEWSYQPVVERHAAERPLDPEIAARLRTRRAWMEGYLQWGRKTLGYGTYLLRRP